MVTACIPLIQFLASWAYYFYTNHFPLWMARGEMAIVWSHILDHTAANVCY